MRLRKLVPTIIFMAACFPHELFPFYFNLFLIAEDGEGEGEGIRQQGRRSLWAREREKKSEGERNKLTKGEY